MTYMHLWDASRVHTVMTTESRQKSRELFLATHCPFKHIRVDFCKEGASGDFVDECELRDIIHAGQLTDDNRLFFVVGEAGCGKSELCQWLEYTADSDKRIAVHIPRSMTNALSVAGLLRSRLGLIAQSTFRSTPLEIQAHLVTLSAVAQWYEGSSPALPASQPWDQILVDPTFIHAVATCLAAIATGEHSPDTEIVSDALLAGLCAKHALKLETSTLAEKGTAIHNLLVQAMESVLWRGDVRKLLHTLSQCAVETGRRPLLLIEDITAFQTFGDILLDYLLDLTSGHMDAVIGVTTGFERSQLPHATLAGDLTHVHQRLRARLVLTDDHGSAYGLEDDLITFARAYLRAVKNTDTATAAEFTFPGFEPDLYPFTETALRRAFAQLEEDGNPRQTPRLYIEHVLAAVLLAPAPPPTTLDSSHYLRRPPTHVRRESTSDAAMNALVRWYGDVDERTVTLDARIATAWGIPTPPDALVGHMLTFPRAYAVRSSNSPQPTPERDRELAELQQWLDHGGYYPTRETLKRAIEHLLQDIGDPRALGSAYSISQTKAELYYARGDERLPIVLDDGSGDVEVQGGTVALHVTRAPAERSLLEELVLRELTGATLVDSCHNVPLMLEWATRYFESYQRDIRVEFARRLGGLDADEFILVSWKLVATLCGTPWRDMPPLALLPMKPIDDETVGPWTRSSLPALFATGIQVSAWSEVVQRLFIGAFALHESFLDIERYQAVSSRINSDRTLALLAAVPPSALSGLPFKVKPGTAALQQLLLDLQSYAKAILKLDIPQALRDDQDDLQHRIEHLGAQHTLDMTTVATRLIELRERCGMLGVTWHPEWDGHLRLLTDLSSDALSTLYESAKQQHMKSATLLMKGCDIWTYQEWRLSTNPVLVHPYWAASRVVTAIQQELLSAARRRVPKVRNSVKSLYSTRDYQVLRAAVRAFDQGVRDEGSLTG